MIGARSAGSVMKWLGPAVALALACAAGVGGDARAHAPPASTCVGQDQPPALGSRCALYHIVRTCLDPDQPGYCRRCALPLEGRCAPDRGCRGTTQFWKIDAEHAAIRDLKMCGCPAGFIHGLVIPSAPISGVEDPARPAGIWAFAWAVALEKIPDPDEIALIVNPPEARRQDQLHVHVVRLAREARPLLAARAVPRDL